MSPLTVSRRATLAETPFGRPIGTASTDILPAVPDSLGRYPRMEPGRDFFEVILEKSDPPAAAPRA
jgi:hypothetical protein